MVESAAEDMSSDSSELTSADCLILNIIFKTSYPHLYLSIQRNLNLAFL